MNATPSRFLRCGLILWALVCLAASGLVRAEEVGNSRLVEWAGRVEISRTNAAFAAPGTSASAAQTSPSTRDRRAARVARPYVLVTSAAAAIEARSLSVWGTALLADTGLGA